MAAKAGDKAAAAAAAGARTPPAVDQKRAVGYETAPQRVVYNRRDVLLYALGVGAEELRFTYELDPDFAALPTYPVVFSFKGTSPAGDSFDVVPFGVPNPKKPKADGMGSGIPRAVPQGIPKYDPNMILHGEQSLEVLRPLPVEGEFIQKGKVIGVWDKGSGMVIENESTVVDAAGTVYVRMVSSTFVRGMGGFGGEKQPKQPTYAPPKRPADATEATQTLPQQAMIYRLSGDYNPLHADPKVATKVGFPRPILHGLCSFGVAARHILKRYAGNDPARFKSIRVRFSSPVFPGETLVTEMWKEGDQILFQVKAKERDVVVISNGVAEVYATPKSRL